MDIGRIVFAGTFMFSTVFSVAQPLQPYSQSIPGTKVTLTMVPVSGNTFEMGSKAGFNPSIPLSAKAWKKEKAFT